MKKSYSLYGGGVDIHKDDRRIYVALQGAGFLVFYTFSNDSLFRDRIYGDDAYGFYGTSGSFMFVCKGNDGFEEWNLNHLGNYLRRVYTKGFAYDIVTTDVIEFLYVADSLGVAVYRYDFDKDKINEVMD